MECSDSSGVSGLVSVIMPVFNGERFLRQAIESVFAQTYRNWELIAVNDGSTDGSAAILADYGAKIRVFHHQENLGAASARNRAIFAARGEWLAFLDQDDLWAPDKLQRQLEAVAPGDTAISTEARVIDENGAVIRPIFSHGDNLEHSTLARTITLNPIYVLTVLIRRQAVLEVGALDAENRYGTDEWQLWMRLLARGHRFRFLPEVLASYRVHPGNTSGDHTSMMRGELFALRRVHKEMRFHGADLRVYRDKAQKHCFNLAWDLWDRSRSGPARGQFLRAAMHGPMSWRAWLCAACTLLPGRLGWRWLRRLAGPRSMPAMQKGWWG
jgi:glycosyltransferase involved in cell wall biosynthesis